MQATVMQQDPDRSFQLLCSCPVDGYEAFARRLRACAAEHLDNVELRWFEHAGALARFTRFAAVVSACQPTVVLLRGDDVICNAIGDLPAHELRSILHRAASVSR